MRPEVRRLVRRLEDAAHALLQRAARVAVTGNDELLPEVVRHLVDPVEARARREHDGGWVSSAHVTNRNGD